MKINHYRVLRYKNQNQIKKFILDESIFITQLQQQQSVTQTSQPTLLEQSQLLSEEYHSTQDELISSDDSEALQTFAENVDIYNEAFQTFVDSCNINSLCVVKFIRLLSAQF